MSTPAYIHAQRAAAAAAEAWTVAVHVREYVADPGNQHGSDALCAARKASRHAADSARAWADGDDVSAEHWARAAEACMRQARRADARSTQGGASA